MIASEQTMAQVITETNKRPADYFADYSAWSQSMLKTFLDRRRKAEAYYVTKAVKPPEPTDPMRKGTAAHTALLEPEKFNDLVVVYPRELLAKNGAVSTSEAKAFRDEHQAAGRIVFKAEDLEVIRAMADAVLARCGKWLALPSMKEKSLYWDDGLSGLRCKGRFDWIISRPDRDYIFDLKTTADASPKAFRKKCEDSGYWLQADHYMAGLQSHTNKPTAFIFVAVESKFPYSVSLHELDSESIASASEGRRDVLMQVARCIETNDWSEPWEDKLNPLQIREWAFNPNAA